MKRPIKSIHSGADKNIFILFPPFVLSVFDWIWAKNKDIAEKRKEDPPPLFLPQHLLFINLNNNMF